MLKYINELSTSIDLNSTRVRAEGLFKKFQRVVEEADRKNAKSPGPVSPGLRHRRGESSSGDSSQATATGSAAKGKGKAIEPATPHISDELRKLLSKEIIRSQGN